MTAYIILAFIIGIVIGLGIASQICVGQRKKSIEKFRRAVSNLQYTRQE